MTSPITISSNIKSREPVFSNARVPVKNLFDYLKSGHLLNEFLEDFPSVTNSQAMDVIKSKRNKHIHAKRRKFFTKKGKLIPRFCKTQA